jgi:hypothetical protein
MRFERIDLRHDDFVKIRTALLDVFDFDPGKRQGLDNLGDRLRERQKLVQPAE